jgi:hypothetical protein
MWLSSLAWQSGTFRDAEGSWWMVFITREFAKIHHCPFCGQQLAYDAEQGFDDLDDWNPAAVKTKAGPVNFAQQAKPKIIPQAVELLDKALGELSSYEDSPPDIVGYVEDAWALLKGK